MSTKWLWEELGLTNDFKIDEVDSCYQQIKEKTAQNRLAWKVLRDKYYGSLYRLNPDLDLIEEAGFFEDTLSIDDSKNNNHYNLNLLSTTFGKLQRNIESLKSIKNGEIKPVVLLSTGGFYPIHEGHFHMMECAKEVLEQNGYDVVGGYFAPDHDSYVSKKPYQIHNVYKRIELCQKAVADSDWLMIDKWPALYSKTMLNFTDILERLIQYLHRYVLDTIQVAYVFGGDNALFSYALANHENVLSVCIDRQKDERFKKAKNQINAINCFFIENTSNTNHLSSRHLRKKYISQTTTQKKGTYVVRNEGIRPLEKFFNKVNQTTLKNAQSFFLSQFKDILLEAFEGEELNIKFENIEAQLEKTRKIVGESPVISLDSYFIGTYNLEVSRQFDLSDLQLTYHELVGRVGKEPLKEQVKHIPKGDYVLVDDDSVSGRTLKSVLEALPNDVHIVNQYFLANDSYPDIIDVVDLRDFIVGAENGGLVCLLPHQKIARVPYLQPYVSLSTRASISIEKEKLISFKLWRLNKQFYEKLSTTILLKDVSLNFQTLMFELGFKTTDSMIKICKWHMDQLQKTPLI